MALPVGQKQLFEYAILHHKTPTKEEADKGQRVISTLVAGPKTLLATNESEATMVIAREIPEEYLGRLDEIEVKIRPF